MPRAAGPAARLRPRLAAMSPRIASVSGRLTAVVIAHTATRRDGADTTRRMPSRQAANASMGSVQHPTSVYNSRRMPSIRVAHFGRGPIGAAVAQEIAQRPGFKIVGAIDNDPAKVGRDIGDVAGLKGRIGICVEKDASRIKKMK